MHLAIYISAAMMGLAGSLHCAGMCGPIALAVPMHAKHGSQRLLQVVLYFLGKTITYVLLGTAFGMLGAQLSMAGWQQGLSIGLGLAMLLFALITFFRPAVFHQNRLTISLGNKLAPVMGYFMGKPQPFVPLVLGMLNGLLPCGLVYLAISAATATGHTGHAAIFMAVFGISTIPLMMMLMLFGHELGATYRQRLRQLMPALTAVVAVLLILRGLSLGIPYLSPEVDAAQHAAASCH